MNYPETKCINCGAVIPARNWPKKVCTRSCSSKQEYFNRRKIEKRAWKQQRQREKVQEGNYVPKTIFLKAPAETSARWWVRMYFKLGHDEMRKMAGLKSEEIRQAETVAELLALRKG